MQDADQRKEAPGGIVIDIGLALQAVLQDPSAFIMDAAPRHIDGFDLTWRQFLDGLVVAFADLPVILDTCRNGLSER